MVVNFIKEKETTTRNTRRETSVERKGQDGLAHKEFEILMEYPSRAVQKIGENPASYSLNILFPFFSPNKSQLCLGQ